MTYATTFSGIGGWELGLNACGWELQWQCEREPFCRQLLWERFGKPIYPDIRTICERNPAPVDALIGSPPCQPFSVAGAQGGTADARHLYPAFIKLVTQIKPRWVLMEQVPNILAIDGGRAFGGYIGGLAALGYDVAYHCIPACAVGANHQRDRLWIMAHATTPQLQRAGRRNQSTGWAPIGFSLLGSNVSNATSQQSGGLLKRQVSANIGTGGDWSGQTGSWATEPNVGRVANGVSFRVDRLKGLGNAVVPQIPFLIGQAINQIESSLT